MTLGPAIATAFLAGTWDEAGLVRRARESLGPLGQEVAPTGSLAAKGTRSIGQLTPWLRPLARLVLATYPVPPLHRRRELAALIDAQPAVRRAAYVVRVRRHLVVATAMGPARWPVRPLPDVGSLRGWLGLDEGELGWFADVQARARDHTAPKLQHYRHAVLPTSSGGVRVLEIPKERLKTMQRRILRDVLDLVPAHRHAHGFVPGRSALTAADPHRGRPAVLVLDLEGFFASVTAARVFGIFAAAGYPEQVAHLLTGLCTTTLPRSVWRRVPVPANAEAHWRLGRHLAAPHLPQGSPTSPALANAVAWTLDARLAGLAASFGLSYTRYADDLAFSGGAVASRKTRDVVTELVELTVRDEGFRVNARKTRVRTRSQQQRLLGLVVNERPAVPRAAYDQLRAVLHNCARHGPESQRRGFEGDFAAHLLGRIGWVAQTSPERGARLRVMYDAIGWE